MLSSDAHATHEEASHAFARYVIEGDVPQIGQSYRAAFAAAAAKSNEALAQHAPAIQWEHGYVPGDKTFCVYLAENEDVIRRHAEISGFPATRITPVPKVIDPTTQSED